MRHLFSDDNITIHFIKHIEDVVITDDAPLVILLVLDLSGTEALSNFKTAVDFLNQINGRKRIGVLVSRYNAYLTWYISRKFRGHVTFFNSHNLQSGLFRRNFLSWLDGKTWRPMRVVARYRDNRYGFSLKEWVSLVIPLSGETVQEMSACMGISEQTLYQIRQNALKKIGINSWRKFCDLYLSGQIKTENDTIIRRY
ncbi:hypothetical protein C3432_19460 [Citrobacter amalonaticus]|uniref:Uncharacterized protein n=2 Tax=Citrobacter amalonaticus TaxID=35703 RepID=A0A2S4RXK3_CITAM|nr:hypothetical protein C3432_19460 [Citrobacter amalonaticus]POT74464.1 hypothetical protein C3436_17100 [Citrobacter amalonaticus]POU65263.1 hypothetical protein C3430_13840 [Citrobacter amalonaticus]POV04098.1 hypothetical protein C3424_18780 [Citrobacter amalonaticus]